MSEILWSVLGCGGVRRGGALTSCKNNRQRVEALGRRHVCVLVHSWCVFYFSCTTPLHPPPPSRSSQGLWSGWRWGRGLGAGEGRPDGRLSD